MKYLKLSIEIKSEGDWQKRKSIILVSIFQHCWREQIVGNHIYYSNYSISNQRQSSIIEFWLKFNVNCQFYLLLVKFDLIYIWHVTGDGDEIVRDDHDNGNIVAKIFLVIDQHSTIKHQSWRNYRSGFT